MSEKDWSAQQTEEAIAEARRSQIAAEEILGFVLLAIGEPVVVPKALLTNGIPKGATIKIDEHVEDDSFVFSVEADVA